MVDGNGILWSAGLDVGRLVRYDPVSGVAQAINTGRYNYGLAVDGNGAIWTSNWTHNTIQRLDPITGAVELTVATGGTGGRGVAVTTDNNIWVANSNSNTVSRFNNAGVLQNIINVGSMPTGVAVDSNGKVWVTNYNSSSLMRIDPVTNLIDLTVELGSGANPYNYSDMTGTVVTGTTNPTGFWRDVIDGGDLGLEWDQISWTELIPDGSTLTIEARAADTEFALMSMAYTTYASGDLIGLFGKFLDVKATFTRTGDDSSILYDLMVTSKDGNQPVPEPGTLVLFGIGSLVLFGARMRKKKK